MAINMATTDSQHLSENVYQLSFPFVYTEQYSVSAHRISDRRWSYLLSDSLAFSKNTVHAIRMQKPAQEVLPNWLQKLITSGQCQTIYVENLNLEGAEADTFKSLCDKFSVSLINLIVSNDENATISENIVVGPWKKTH